VTLYDLFHAQAGRDPEATAVVFGEQRVSYRALDAEVDRAARGLHALGVRAGEHVLALAANKPGLIAAYLAVTRLGAVYVPVSPTFRGREGAFVLANARPRLALVDEGLAGELLSWEGSAGLDLVVFRATPGEAVQPGNAVDFDDLGVGQPAVPALAVDDEAGVLLCYTSGTASVPKPVLHSHRSEVYNATTYAEVWGLAPGDRGVVPFPLAWVYGLSTTTAALLVSGGTVVLLDRFHPVRVLDAIASERATAFWGTMSMYTKLLEVMRERGDTDLGSLRLAVNGGEPCPPPLVREFERASGVPLLAAYATSEARPVLAVRPGDRDVPEGTAGRLVPGAEIRLEAPDGSEVPDGEPGHALLRCPGLMTKYYGEPEMTAERLTADGWLKSGDLLHRDADGYYFVDGRQSDMIIRSGVNIAPAEVVSALVALPGVADAGVVGIPDARSGEAVRAYVVAKRGVTLTADEIRASLAGQLAAFKIPQEIIFIDDLPRTDRGKVDRVALRTLAAS
jgi:acyl-coenzyme A synthetase/AMP-(fatty) acid ligase